MEARLDAAFKAATDSKKIPSAGGIILDKSGKTLWSGAYGTTDISNSAAAAFTLDTPMMIFSCTKLVTTILALQLIEEGRLSLDDPVEKHDPDWKDIKVLDGVRPEDKLPNLREPKTKATIKHLMTHTAGLAYDFFDPKMLQYRIATGQQPAQTMAAGVKDTFKGPLMFDPGREYEYGMNTDWLGFVVEKIMGKKIADVLEEKISKPLGLKNTRSKFKDDKWRMILHYRMDDGNVVPVPDSKPKEDDDVVNGGGEFMISTLNDYMKILVSLLNGGEHPTSKTRILKEETVKKYLFTDLISDICSPDNVGLIPQAIPMLTNVGEMLPGVKKTWSAALLINETDAPSGRTAGSGMWAGLGNLYYWIDPKKEIVGFYGSNLIPFLDKECCDLFDEMERAAYGKPALKGSDGETKNWSPVMPSKASL